MSNGVGGLVVLLVVLGALLVVLRTSQRFARRPRNDRFWIVCPRGAGAVLCTFVRDAGTGCWADVVRCSAFVAPADVSCPKDCMKLANQTLEGGRA